MQVKQELDQIDNLLHEDSVLFKHSRWKVLFSENFRDSFGNLVSTQEKKWVVYLLLKLSSGWRPKKGNVYTISESSLQLVKQIKIGNLYIIWSVDIMKYECYLQVLKIWDVLPQKEISQLVERLDNIFVALTEDFLSLCQIKCMDGNLEVPMSWPRSCNIVQFKNTCFKSNVASSRMNESLLLMKFYCLSSGVVRHLLSGLDGSELDLPFEVTEQEREVILYPHSMFILGRSGTGKTTVLSMKMIQKEQQYYLSLKGNSEVEFGKSKEIHNANVLRQMFVTVNPKLCSAVKNQVSQLKSFSSGGSFSEADSIDMYDIYDTNVCKDIPGSFVDVPPTSYPLVITFQEFLMMLDSSSGNSFFDRYHDVNKFQLGASGNFDSVAFQAFIRMKEVRYEKFKSLYWPHFNSKLTKELDSSIVFTEITSHIKGGIGSGKAQDGKLSRKDYLALFKVRVSALSREKREAIYDIFLDYEKKKLMNGEFDLADLVIDLHRRLRGESYEFEKVDLVYVDEVQDLTIRQIALFRYICRNTSDGFAFAGDSAQTIHKGIDFRFQDMRSLFFKEFLLESRTNSNNGGKRSSQSRVPKIFQLNQNFRTHAGVLNLAQSVIDLLYRFFPHSIDVLRLETSSIEGEAPVILYHRGDENPIQSIFGNNCNNTAGHMIGFGADQVILVRDDSSKKEVTDLVGKQALVLTILECKGLDFQDVLLYNFFGSSPLKNQWRVLYEYMNEQGMLDSNAPRSFPSFDMAKHNLLCSELKQLYVAITRARKRLWICEESNALSNPMLAYWENLSLVRFRQLHGSLEHGMKVTSRKEEWLLLGTKLFNEGHFDMAAMCFERAGDTYREKWAKASGLRAAADRWHSPNSKMRRIALLEAAGIYEEIGRAESAAKCFIELEDFKRAGMIYMERFGESRAEDAGDLFSMAECWCLAAKAYAKGNYFSKCLAACTKGKLFEMGLQFLKCWKENSAFDTLAKLRSFDEIEQAFLENCTRCYHKLKNTKSAMVYCRKNIKLEPANY